jgi:hypothetical protein
METNTITITNIVFLVSTNPVPVVLSGLTFDVQVQLFFEGFAFAFPFSCCIALIWVLARALRPPRFPSSDE